MQNENIKHEEIKIWEEKQKANQQFIVIQE